MTKNIYQSLYEQKKQTTPIDTILNGVLGVNMGGKSLVEVPGRSSFVYVRLRQNPNEVIQAFNNQISQVYDLPVQVHYKGFRYEVIGLDTTRYGNNWADGSTSYLPKHGIQHTFPDNLTSGGGGDVAFIYPRQYMPMLGMPSGSLGGPNILVNSYIRKLENGNWFYDNLTGTQNLVPTYNPPGANAVMGLVYKDYDSGNPYFIINSGSYFSNSITGTSQIIQYLPALPSPRSIPIMAVRLVSGTSSIGWDNLVDVRQWYYPVPTGSGGGGIPDAPADGKTYGRNNNIWVNATGTGGAATNPAGSNQYVQYNQSGSFGADPNLVWNYANQNLFLGGVPPVLNTNTMHILGATGSGGSINLWEFGGTVSPLDAPYIQNWRADGTLANPTNIKSDMSLWRIGARGYKATTWSNTIAQIVARANADATDTSTPTCIEFYTTPTGTTTMVLAATLPPDGSLNMASHKITSLANATVAGNAVAFGQSVPAKHFLDVSVIGGTQNIGQAFTTLVLPTISSDAEGNYNASTYIYTVPETGLYQIASKMRIVDSATAAISIGIGVNTSNVDGPWFLWGVTNPFRNGLLNIRLARFNSGDLIRTYAYVDLAATLVILKASMNISFLGT